MLNRLALRLCTVRALRGATLVGKNVLDSQLAPIDELAEKHPTPFISVYTDDGHFRSSGVSLYSTDGDHRHDVGFQRLVIEVAMTVRMKIVDPETGAALVDPVTGNLLEDAVPVGTDPSLEFNLDLIERQIRNALMFPANPWAEMWRQFVQDIGDHESKRGQGARDGLRFSGRQITIHARLPSEHPLGRPVPPLWQKFLALCEADADLAELVPQMRRALVGEPAADYDQVQAQYGLTEQAARALGHGPVSVSGAAGLDWPRKVFP